MRVVLGAIRLKRELQPTDFTKVLLWRWLARGQFTAAGVSLVAAGLLIPILALTYVHLSGSKVVPTKQAAAAASGFMAALQRQDIAAEQRLLSPDAPPATRQFASIPFAMTGYVERSRDVFWGFRYAVTGHPGIQELRLAISCVSHCSVRDVLIDR